MVSNPTLWRRIQAHPFDDPAAALPFTDRLAAEETWPMRIALRALEEYRRFVYLACVAGHEVTPSREVDAVWHLHLTYSRDYWDVFCARTLGLPLHHTPTAGGAAADRRYRNNYHATLQAYAREFGSAPPADLWPPEEQRFAPLGMFNAHANARPSGATRALRRIMKRQHPAAQWLLSLLISLPAIALVIAASIFADLHVVASVFFSLAIPIAVKVFLTADPLVINQTIGGRRNGRRNAGGCGGGGCGDGGGGCGGGCGG